ncbi:MAG: SDR family oxidoreductase [Burkholderiales bacterium]|nr:SDR family oxidoreductase [Burkholderiales bacterium]MDE2274734.1 SDR family oxidoreductase [Burkholderiales bacterium]
MPPDVNRPVVPVVLVTGAARRIGRAIALELARHGWRVAVHYRGSAAEAAQTVALIAQAGGTAQAFAADLADEAQCEALLPAVQAAFGRVDAVVNNASLFGWDDVAGFRTAAMEAHWRANTAPAIILARALHAGLAARPADADAGAARGCVVNLLDQKLFNPNPDYLSYTLSKAALQAATAMLAQALAPAVRVCAVAPGVTLLSGAMSDAEFDAAHRMTPLQRGSTPQDVAGAVRFLLESPAITGSTLLVDGGQHLQPQARDVMFLARQAGPPPKDV